MPVSRHNEETIMLMCVLDECVPLDVQMRFFGAKTRKVKGEDWKNILAITFYAIKNLSAIHL